MTKETIFQKKLGYYFKKRRWTGTGVIRDPPRNNLIDTHLMESIAQIGEERALRQIIMAVIEA